jgi:hypothetical protein
MPNYKAALAALESVRLIEDTDNFANLSALMVRACDRAITWNAAADPYEKQRYDDRQFITSGAPAHDVRQRHLAELARIIAALCAPGPKRRTEAMHGDLVTSLPRSNLSIAILESGALALPPGKT